MVTSPTNRIQINKELPWQAKMLEWYTQDEQYVVRCIYPFNDIAVYVLTTTKKRGVLMLEYS
jgi:hypothetical protein